MKHLPVIYALCDPREPDPIKCVRYVGKSLKGLAHRVQRHVQLARGGSRFHVHCWLRSLLRKGVAPRVKVLKVTTRENAGQDERRAIAIFRHIGVDLTNLTDGGEGVLGLKITEATRAQLIASHLGKRQTAATRAKRAGSIARTWLDPDIRLRRTVAMTGRRRSAALPKESAALKGTAAYAGDQRENRRIATGSQAIRSYQKETGG